MLRVYDHKLSNMEFAALFLLFLGNHHASLKKRTYGKRLGLVPVFNGLMNCKIFTQ